MIVLIVFVCEAFVFQSLEFICSNIHIWNIVVQHKMYYMSLNQHDKCTEDYNGVAVILFLKKKSSHWKKKKNILPDFFPHIFKWPKDKTEVVKGRDLAMAPNARSFNNQPFSRKV